MMNFNKPFVPDTSKTIAIVGFTVWGLVFLFVFLSIVLFADRQYMATEVDALGLENDQLAEKNQYQENRIQNSAPSHTQITGLVKKVALYNEISAANTEDVASLLTRIERVLPQEAFVTSFKHSQSSGMAWLKVTSTRTDRLTGLLNNLQAESVIKRATLIQQSKLNDQQDSVEFEIKLVMK